MIATIQLLEKIHVKLATQLAFYLFFRPIPFSTPAREKPTEHKAKKSTGTVNGKPFNLYEWGEGEKQILVLHGWSGRATQFYPIIEHLLSQQYKVIGIDAPAHGETKEKTTNMLEFVQAVEVAQQRFGNFHALLGHSLGGMALFNAIDRYEVSNRIVVIGTPASVPFVVQDFCDKIGGSPKMASLICERIERDFDTDIEKISTNYLSQKLNPYGMVFHDEDDRDVGIENAKNTARNWANGTLHITKGLGHRRILNDKTVIEEISTFLAKSDNELKKNP